MQSGTGGGGGLLLPARQRTYTTVYMSSRALGGQVRVDADDFVLFEGSGSAGETFIFEPTATEQNLGFLFAAAETDDRTGVGRELLETVVQALQREYYRDPARGMLPGFESALHQANLVLYDLTEQGVRDWMSTFHASVGVLAGASLHVSTAGAASVLLARAQRVTSITAGLSHSPITDPLRTFSQVASGVLRSRDMIFFATANFDAVYRPADLTRFVVDQSAATITLRLRQLHEDRGARLPVAALVVSILPRHLAQTAVQREDLLPERRREPVPIGSHLMPRKPIVIHRSLFRRLLVLSLALARWFCHHALATLWPYLRAGSRKGGRALMVASRLAGQRAQAGWQRIRTKSQPSRVVGGGLQPQQLPLRRFLLGGARRWPRLWQRTRGGFARLPRTSKVLALVALILAGALVFSVVLLQRKRTADEQIQHASELLHEARTKKEAAETALIYDNRDQARLLLTNATSLADQAAVLGVYEDQVATLRSEITGVTDRLDKITRLTPHAVQVIGDFAGVLPQTTPITLLYLNGDLYTFDPATNAIAKMARSGGEVSLVNQTTQGIGFFVRGVTHAADKLLILQTDEPGVAVYDVKANLLQKQDIAWPGTSPDIVALAVFGSRLYAFDRASHNVYTYAKTLRGYSGGEAWITAADFPGETVTDMGVDGNIYTLHRDGVVRKLFKGELVDFTLEAVDPPLSADTSLLINEELGKIYLLDREHRRIVVYDTKGTLLRQFSLSPEAAPTDIAVDPDETTLYVLSGTQVLAAPLKEKE